MSPDERDEQIDDAIYAFNAAELLRLLRRHGIDPNHRIGQGEFAAPLLHLALDAEVDRGIGDPSYVPDGACIVALLEVGADPQSEYLGESFMDKINVGSGLARLRIAVERAVRRQEPGTGL